MLLLTVPCYNEATRLDAKAFQALAEPGKLHLVFVNDGSVDNTATVLRQIQQGCPKAIDLLHLPKNQGKAEAVRMGMQHGMARQAEWVGYYDADMSTPPDELKRLWQLSDGHQVSLAIRKAGQTIISERSWFRDLLTRLCVIWAQWLLEMPIADTQCGAKLFRAGPALHEALSRPFHSRWVFDVELLGRLRHGGTTPAVTRDQFLQMPLLQWDDHSDSRFVLSEVPRTLLDLCRISWSSRRNWH